MPLWFNEQQFQDELIKPAKRKTAMTQNPVCNAITPPQPQKASRPQRFSGLVAKQALQNGIESCDIVSQATKEMNPTTALLITTVTVTVAMNCTPEA